MNRTEASNFGGTFPSFETRHDLLKVAILKLQPRKVHKRNLSFSFVVSQGSRIALGRPAAIRKWLSKWAMVLFVGFKNPNTLQALRLAFFIQRQQVEVPLRHAQVDAASTSTASIQTKPANRGLVFRGSQHEANCLEGFPIVGTPACFW